MKKILFLLLALILACSAFVGQASAAPRGSAQTVEMAKAGKKQKKHRQAKKKKAHKSAKKKQKASKSVAA